MGLIQGEEIEVEGVLTPADFDENGGILSLRLSSPGEKEYLIFEGSDSSRIRSYLRQRVFIRGVVYEDDLMRLRLVVRSIQSTKGGIRETI